MIPCHIGLLLDVYEQSVCECHTSQNNIKMCLFYDSVLKKGLHSLRMARAATCIK